jgi:hypothetical protein
MHRRAVVLLAVLISVALPPSLRAQAAQDSVVATVQEFFRAMTANDTAAMARVLKKDGQYYGTRQGPDSLMVFRMTNAAYIEGMPRSRDTMVERMWNPLVQVHGPIAAVWAPYDIYRNGEFVHCGVDAFHLIRTPRGWQIAAILFTMEPTGCAPSPLGPLKK